MTRSAVELDFFRLERESSSSSVASLSPHSRPKRIDRRRSFRDIQSVISKINPEVLKAVIESGSATQEKAPSNGRHSIPNTPRENHDASPTFPLHAAAFRPVSGPDMKPESSSPLTIFYNGTVAVFDLPPHKAEGILKLAGEGYRKPVESADSKSAAPGGQQPLLETLNGDLPIARRKSLQTFLQKRKERVTSASPFFCPSKDAVSARNGTSPRD